MAQVWKVGCEVVKTGPKGHVITFVTLTLDMPNHGLAKKW